MSINSIGSSVPSAADIAAMRKQMFQRTDSNSDGSVDSKELANAVKDAPKPQGASTSGTPDAAALFSQIDADGDEKITEAEMDAATAQGGGTGKGSPAGGRPAGGSPPAGAPPSGGAPAGGGKSQGSGGASGASSSASDEYKVYDKKDADKDGEVSEQEKIDYRLKHPEEAAKEDEVATFTRKRGNADGTGLYVNSQA